MYPGLPRYIGRKDLVWLTKNNDLEIVDHKTSKAQFKTALASFDMSLQTLGYLTAGELYHDRIPKMIYSMSYFKKSAIHFDWFQIHKSKSALEQFISDLVYYLQNILLEVNEYNNDIATCHDRTDHLQSFRRNNGYACTSYFRKCTYFDLCKIRNNPLLWLDKPPQGYHFDEWDPDLHDDKMRKMLEEAA